MQELLQKAKEFLQRRRQAYVTTFRNPVGEEVLRDLAKFCRATESTFHTDPGIARQLDGRREVWIRIQQQLNMTEDELWKKFGRSNLNN